MLAVRTLFLLFLPMKVGMVAEGRSKFWAPVGLGSLLPAVAAVRQIRG